MESGNMPTKDPHLINISVYKPNALFSFWSWFSRKNKNNLTDILEKGETFDINLNMENLNALKMNGIGIQKLQNGKFTKSNGMCKNNVFLNPKGRLSTNDKNILNDTVISNLIKMENSGKNKKIFERRIMSTSTISIKSRTNFGTRNVKYIRNITSQKSIVNSMSNSHRKTKVKDYKSAESNPFNKSILLKSVPSEILKSNTQKKVFVPLHIGRRKTEKTNNKTQYNKLQDISDTVPEQKRDEPSVIPIILTKIQSMEEQLCNIGNTTKKINEVVSQNTIKQTTSSAKALNHNHENRQSHLKGLPSRKIYLKNIQTSRKLKQSAKKLKHKSKLTIPAKLNEHLHVHDMRFHGLNIDQNPLSNIKKPLNVNKSFNISTISLGAEIVANNVPFKDNSTKLNNANEDPTTVKQSKELTKINTTKIDYDFILNLLKGMSDAKDSEVGFVKPSTKNTKQNTIVDKNVLVNTNVLMSKPTFDWKHKSLSSASETHTEKDFKNKPDANKVTLEKKFPDIKMHNFSNDVKSSILKYKDISGQNTSITELTKETDNIVKEYKIQKQSVSTTPAKPSPEATQLLSSVQIAEKESTKQDRSLIVCREMIKMLKERNDCKTPKMKNENESVDSELKTNSEQHCLSKSQAFDPSGEHEKEDTPQCTQSEVQSKQKLNPYINEIHSMKETLVRKMITRATQSEQGPNDGVKVCVETPSGDKVKIENLSSGKGLTVVATGGVSLVNANTVFNGKSVNVCEENKTKNICILQKNVNVSTNKCITSETGKKENISLKVLSNYEDSIDKRTINKQGHIYNGIDKFVPAKKIESGKNEIRCPGEYISQAKRKTYEELLKQGSLLNRSLTEAIQRSNVPAKTNEITVLEEPFIKSLNDYSMAQEEKRNSFVSMVDIKLNPQNKLISTSCTDRTRLIINKRESESVIEKITKPKYGNPVKSMKKANIPDIDQSPVNKQSFFTVKDEKDELHSGNGVIHQTSLELKKRICRYGLTIQEPIPEEPENADEILINNINDCQTEKGDNIKVKSLNNDFCTELFSKNIRERSQKENNCEVFSAQIKNEETALNCLKDLTCMKTSVSVQTDWSLIGITVEHFKQAQPCATYKASVSSQTEITMDHLTIPKTLLPITCTASGLNSNSTEAGKSAANCDSSWLTSVDKTPDCDEKILNIAATVDKEIDRSDKILQSIANSNFNASKQSKSNYANVIDFKMFTVMRCDKQELDLRKITNDKTSIDQHHDCLISCFPSISQETIQSDISGTEYELNLPTEINSNQSEMEKKSVISYNINKEVKKCPNITNIVDGDKGSSPLFQTSTNPKTNQSHFRSQNNTNVTHFLPFALNNNYEVKSGSGLLSNSITPVGIVTTNGETYSPIKEAHGYPCNIFQNNIFNQISRV